MFLDGFLGDCFAWRKFGSWNSTVVVSCCFTHLQHLVRTKGDKNKIVLLNFCKHGKGLFLGLLEFQLSVLQIKWTSASNHSILHAGISVYVASQNNISIFTAYSQFAVSNQAVSFLSTLCDPAQQSPLVSSQPWTWCLDRYKQDSVPNHIHISTLRTRTEMVFKTVFSLFNHSTQLTAWENFIILSHQESNRSYKGKVLQCLPSVSEEISFLYWKRTTSQSFCRCKLGMWSDLPEGHLWVLECAR